MNAARQLANHVRKLLSDSRLLRSSTVANCQMNRARSLTGTNGYALELGFNPLVKLREAVGRFGRAGWLDLCCGTGDALIEADETARMQGWGDALEIVGVDLVGQQRCDQHSLRLIRAALPDWQPARSFDLITCVHGLHYLGDKLKVIGNAASWLTDDGTFCANIDLNNIKLRGAPSTTRTIARELRQRGLAFDTRNKRLSCMGRKWIQWRWNYLGGDDLAGPNFTGQPAVDSYYDAPNEPVA